MSLRRGRARAELNAEINVVSLIDVMMLLLVIFMITAPIMQGGVEITLPEATAQATEPKEFVVTVARDGIYIDQQKLSLAEFRASFRSLVGSRTKDGVVLLADRSVSYDNIMQVMDVFLRAGVKDVTLGTNPPQESGR